MKGNYEKFPANNNFFLCKNEFLSLAEHLNVHFAADNTFSKYLPNRDKIQIEIPCTFMFRNKVSQSHNPHDQYHMLAFSSRTRWYNLSSVCWWQNGIIAAIPSNNNLSANKNVKVCLQKVFQIPHTFVLLRCSDSNHYLTIVNDAWKQREWKHFSEFMNKYIFKGWRSLKKD